MKRAIAIVVSLLGRAVGAGTLPVSIARLSRPSWRAITGKASRLMQEHLLATMKLVLEFSVGDQARIVQLIKSAREETLALLAHSK